MSCTREPNDVKVRKYFSSVLTTKIEFAMLEASIAAERSSVVVGGASVV
jgi:hypothetical protein